MTDNLKEVLKQHAAKILRVAMGVSQGVGGIQGIEELVSAGNVALWQCHQRFDTKHLSKADFWGYAQKRVRGAMFDSLRKTDNLSRGGRRLVKTNNLGKTPWAAVHRVSLANLRELSSESNPLDELIGKIDGEKIKRLISLLPCRQRKIVDMYFMEEMKLKDIGKCLTISESRVSQIKLLALKLMKKLLDTKEITI